MDSSALRVYNIYTPSADEAIFAAFPWGKIEHLRHLCRSLQRSAKTPQRCSQRYPFLEFYGVRGFTFSRILWGAGFWQIMSNHEKCAACCVYFGARGTLSFFWKCYYELIWKYMEIHFIFANFFAIFSLLFFATFFRYCKYREAPL